MFVEIFGLSWFTPNAPKNDKNGKYFRFSTVLASVFKFSVELVAYNLGNGQKGKLVVLEVYAKKQTQSELKAQSATDKDKYSKIHRFFTILCNFSLIFKKICGSERSKRSTTNRFVVQ